MQDDPLGHAAGYVDGARSILGAKGTGLGTIAKAAIDTGLTRPFPSIREGRLERTLLQKHPAYAAVRLFRDEGRAAAAAAAFLPPGEDLATLMPFAEHYAAAVGAAAAVTADLAMPRVAMPRLPCPVTFAPAALLFRDAQAALAVSGDLVPPLALACAHRALTEFDRFAVDYAETLWKKADRRLRPYFERHGPYLRLRPDLAAPGDEARYGLLFAAALGAGVLLSPDPAQPSILPGDFDDGELAKLAKALGV